MLQIDSVAFELECVIRVVIAALCGAIVGLERKNRLKEAGTRTHLVVCFASALFIVVSKYGFFDIVDYGVSKKFLESEFKKAIQAVTTPNCKEKCSGCGINRFCGRDCFANI